MPRRKTVTADEPAGTPTVSPHVIAPTAVYSAAEARAALRLTASTIRREVREGRLRIAKRAGKYYLLGSWLLEWLAEGEVVRRQRPAARAPAELPHPVPQAG